MTHDPLCPIINTTCIDGPHVLILEPAPGYYLCDACQRECQCDLITAAHERGYKEAEENNKNKKSIECIDSPYGRHGNFIFTKKEDLCGFCHKNVTHLFEMGQ